MTGTARQRDPIHKLTTKDGQTHYRFVIDVGPSPSRKRNQETHTFRTLKEARAERARIISDRDQGKLVKRTKITFDELCQRWLDSRHDVREVSRISYRNVLKVARDQLGRIKVQEITRSDVESVIRVMQAGGRAHRTIVYTLGAVRQVLAYGITEGAVGINVAASVKAPRKQHSDDRPKIVWEPEERARFLAVADADEWAAAWRLTLCGLRRSEVLGMAWGAVDLERGEVMIQAGRVLLDGHRTAVDDPKSTASRRTVPVEQIQPGTVALLRSLKHRQRLDRLALGPGYPDTGLVLVDAIGQPVRPEAFSDRFRRLCRQAGVRVVDLRTGPRHTLALIMHRAQVPPVDAAALLGHTVEVHYAHYLPSSERGTRSAAAALGVALAAGL